PRGCPSEPAAVETGTRVAQADVPPDPADPAVPAGAHDERCVGLEALAIGVAHPVVPAAEEGADHGADAVGAVREFLPADDRGEPRARGRSRLGEAGSTRKVP